MTARYRVNLHDSKSFEFAETTLPFAPFAGLHLQPPWLDGAYMAVSEIWWDSENGVFDVYLTDCCFETELPFDQVFSTAERE